MHAFGSLHEQHLSHQLAELLSTKGANATDSTPLMHEVELC